MYIYIIIYIYIYIYTCMHAKCVYIYIHVQCMYLEEIGYGHCTVGEPMNENGLKQPLDVMTRPADGCNPITNT